MGTKTSGTYYVSEPWDEESREFIASSRRVAAEQIKKYEGTFDKATASRYETMTFTKLMSTL